MQSNVDTDLESEEENMFELDSSDDDSLTAYIAIMCYIMPVSLFMLN